MLTKNGKTPVEIVLAFNERYAQRDIDGAMKFLSDDFIRRGDRSNWEPINKERWALGQRGWMLGWPNWTWDLVNIVSSGNTVVCEFVEHGTWTEPYTNQVNGLTLAADGTAYKDHDCIWFRINEDGLISEIRAWVTNNHLRQYDFDSKYKQLESKAT